MRRKDKRREEEWGMERIKRKVINWRKTGEKGEKKHEQRQKEDINLNILKRRVNRNKKWRKKEGIRDQKKQK